MFYKKKGHVKNIETETPVNREKSSVNPVIAPVGEGKPAGAHQYDEKINLLKEMVDYYKGIIRQQNDLIASLENGNNILANRLNIYKDAAYKHSSILTKQYDELMETKVNFSLAKELKKIFTYPPEKC